MHSLVARASLPGPFVLVGHSLGALYVRLYAARFPADVAGLVVVDGTTEDEDVRLWTLLPPAVLSEADSDDHVGREGIHADALRTAMAQLRAANRSLGDKPFVVLTAGQSDDIPGISPEINAQMAKLSREMQAALTSLSSNGAQVVAPKSHHFIQFEAPKLVIAAVQEVVGAVRTHGRIDPAPLRALALTN
jgi:pimeloyl-ACP methyl ester carboxylesterase